IENLQIEVSESAYGYICELGYDKNYGARPIKRTITREIETPLSRLILNGDYQPGDLIKVDYSNNKLIFS
ncbi:MAG: hypothetical protein ACRC37_02640, partial [Lentisphaeria bacterium]